MNRTHRVIITSLLTVVFIVWQAPASLIGVVLKQASNRTLDFANASGTIWNGNGVIVSNYVKNLRQMTSPPLDWKLIGLNLSGLSFKVRTNGQPLGDLQIRWNRWQARLHGLSMEAKEVTPLLPGLLSKGEWQGLLNFRDIAVQGDWQSTRVTQVEVEWLNATTGLVPKGELGNFTLKGQSEGASINFSISSQEGPLIISGQGNHSAQSGFQFNGELTDNAGLVSQFPGFLEAYLQTTGTPNRYTLNLSKLAL